MHAIATFADRILSLHGWVALTLVFLLPALEASAFVGFVFPGEIAVILGGVLASQGRISLWSAIAAAVLGAVIGDSIGYSIGRRWGRSLLHGTVGRLPFIRRELDRHLDKAEAFVKRRQGSAVFFGRFTAALRVLVPGLAGMSGVHYPTFLVYNVAGGAVWGTAFAFLGYLAGESYKRVERIASRVGLTLLGLVVLFLVLSRVYRRYGDRMPRLRAIGDRLAATRPLAWVRSRFPRQVAWSRARLDARSPAGFALTFAVALCAWAVWSLFDLTQAAFADRDPQADVRTLAWVVAHRTGWLTATMRIVTWLGSVVVIVPLLVIVSGSVFVARRDWRPAAMLALTVGGAILLEAIVRGAVGRARPPAELWIGHYSGAAFPSGHATQAVAFYGMLALIASSGQAPRQRTLLWSAAALLVLIVGASRLYLGAHWLTDVLGGYALGGAWLMLVMALVLLAARDRASRAAS